MTKGIVTFASLLSLLSLTACGGGSGSSGGTAGQTNTPDPAEVVDPGPATGQFPDSAMWSGRANYRNISSDVKNQITKVAHGPDGSVCYTYAQSAADNTWTSKLECLAPQGDLLFSKEQDGLSAFKDIAFTPLGNLITVGLQPVGPELPANPERSYVVLSKFSMQGDALTETRLVDAPDAADLIEYDVQEDGTITTIPVADLNYGNNPTLPNNALLSLKVEANAVYLLAYTYGIKVYAMNLNLSQTWDRQVMPTHFAMWRRVRPLLAKIAVSEGDDRIAVAFETKDAFIPVYEQHFGRMLQLSNLNEGDNDEDIAVTLLTTQGHYLDTLLLDKQFDESLGGVVVQNGEIWIGGDASVQKPGGGVERDFFLAEFASDGSLHNYTLIDHKQDEAAVDFQALDIGKFLFSGSTSSTNGVTAGLLLQVTNEAKKLRFTEFSAAQSAHIAAASPLGNSQILFGMVYDQTNINLTCGADGAQCNGKSVIGVAGQ
ncbi:hypothetical protein HCH_03876 [Hahella chejuensis KCTC 2396]|uniref:Uncharacterized protein n=1 Tax=Hahella chejuensis (strain KCTC 2396) TaxID=349521 RepID=Q2SFH1_HAHCH|nr:hypothetical protein [Hahella chejuensis]ABC30603.1 hypothetical protein HCH_03876 [Hahella chejuensis KCTC 2396]